jgi:hypothetical protein
MLITANPSIPVVTSLSVPRAYWRQCGEMRCTRRRKVILLVLTIVFVAVGLWICLFRKCVPQSGTKREFYVYASAELYDLLLDRSVANCSGTQSLKVK